jgi:hypothetical protein
MDDMIELARIIDPEMRPAFYKRIADIALFLSGIFPEHAALFAAPRRTMYSARRTLTKGLRAHGKTFLPRGRAGNGPSKMQAGPRNARGKIHLGSTGAH